MPLTRDQQAASEKSKSVADFAASRQHARSAGPQDLDHGGRPATSTNGLDEKSQSRTRGRSLNGSGNVPHARKVYGLSASDAIPAQSAQGFEGFKVPVTSTLTSMKPRVQQRQSSSHIGPKRNSQQKNNMHTTSKVQSQAHGSVFDETTSFNISDFDDSNVQEEQTAVLNPLPQPARPRTNVQHGQGGGHAYAEYDDGGLQGHDTQDVLQQLGYQSDSWQQEVDEERAHQARLGSTPNPRKAPNPFGGNNGQRSMISGPHAMNLPSLPETPSRAPSAPPIGGKIHAPAPHRKVGFVNTPQFHSDVYASPRFRSEELAREDSPSLPIQRPSSAHSMPQSMALHPRSQPLHQDSRRSEADEDSSAIQPARFAYLKQHRDVIMQQQEPKVAASESDVQDPSEDEQVQMQPEEPRPVPKQHEPVQVIGLKRSFDNVSVLDYSSEELKKKTLADLQKEPFVKDPRDAPREPARDKHGNEMSLPDTLSRLRNLTSEQKRETFRTLTDEEWAQTGHWFVGQFQTGLQELMEVRLKRRQIALTFEDKVRRRQRVVEYQQAGVQKQLKELQEGGTGLLRDRPSASGSRAGTPMRPARG